MVTILAPMTIRVPKVIEAALVGVLEHSQGKCLPAQEPSLFFQSGRGNLRTQALVPGAVRLYVTIANGSYDTELFRRYMNS